MADIKYLVGLDVDGNINLNTKELQFASIHPLAANPASPTPSVGQTYWNTANDELRVYNGSVWIAVGADTNYGQWQITDGSQTDDVTTNQIVKFAANSTAGAAATGLAGTGTSLDPYVITYTFPNDFLTGLSFDDTNGILTATVSNQSDVTVDLDGRYALAADIPTNIVETITTTDGTYIDLTPNTATDGNVTVTAELSGVDGTAAETSAGNGIRYLSKNNKWAEISSIPGTYDWEIQGDTGGPTTVASGDTIDFAGGTNVTTAFSGTTLTINSTDQFQGTLTSITEGAGITVTSSATSPTVAVDYSGNDNYLLEAGAATVAGSDDIINFSANTDNNVKQTALGDIPIAAFSEIKTYVDNSVAGGLIYQGGYDAQNNIPDLDSSPSSSIKKGWTYTVTSDGSFFTEQVRVGDLIIAEIDSPTSLSDWTTVQNNIDLASSTQIGIGNVVPSASDPLLGINVSYSSGTASVGLDIDGLANFGSIVGADTSSIKIPVFDGDSDDRNESIELDQIFSAKSTNVLIGNGSATSFQLQNSGATGVNKNHGLGTYSGAFMIQLVDTSSGETVYADVERGSSGIFTVTFNTAPASNGIRVLIQNVN
jgi:hypothetical protein